MEQGSAKLGILAMIGACTIWGLSGMFYAQLRHVPALEVLSWRTGASAVFFVLVLAVQGRLRSLPPAFAPRRAGRVALAALFISTNWFGFIFSIQAGHAVEASLGYYIFPLVAVLLGRLLFGEALGPLQWVAVGLAALAVTVLTWGLGVPPWIALMLAGTFAAYGVLKKGLDLGPVVSVTAEVLMLLPLALYWAFAQGHGFHWDGRTLALLLASGPITGGPLILFSYAARRVRLSTVGLIQYMNPTLQFLVAVLVFREPFTPWHMIAFPMIWAALALYSAVSLRGSRAARKAASAAGTSAATVK
ncbi:MAG: protein RarD [Rhodobacterales bacterium]|nr:MAG: protein RarD [Rhodobacterales bacterium]